MWGNDETTMMYLSVGKQQLRYKQVQTRNKYVPCKVNNNACPLTPTKTFMKHCKTGTGLHGMSCRTGSGRRDKIFMKHCKTGMGLWGISCRTGSGWRNIIFMKHCKTGTGLQSISCRTGSGWMNKKLSTIAKLGQAERTKDNPQLQN